MYGYSHEVPDAAVGSGRFEQVNVVPYGKEVGQYVAQHFTGVGIITGQLGRGDAEGYRTGFLKGARLQGRHDGRACRR